MNLNIKEKFMDKKLVEEVTTSRQVAIVIVTISSV